MHLAHVISFLLASVLLVSAEQTFEAQDSTGTKKFRMSTDVSFDVSYTNENKTTTQSITIKDPIVTFNPAMDAPRGMQLRIEWAPKNKAQPNNTWTTVFMPSMLSNGWSMQNASKLTVTLDDIDQTLSFVLDTSTVQLTNQTFNQSYYCKSSVRYYTPGPSTHRLPQSSSAVLNMANTQIAIGAKNDFYNDHFTCVADWINSDETGTWNVSNGCIMMQSNIKLHIGYRMINDTLNNVAVTVPKDAIVLVNPSSCHADTTVPANLVLGFFDDWELTFNFHRNTSANTFMLADSKLTAKLGNHRDAFPFAKTIDSLTFETSGVVPDLSASVNNSYQCMSGTEEFTLNDRPNQGQVNVTLTKLKLQAYAHSTDFQTPTICGADGHSYSSDLVPIIVGASLALLVVIVLVTYLIGRARAKRQGYSSV